MKNNDIQLTPKVVRVRLADWFHAFLMLIISIAIVAVLLIFEWQGWSDGVIGSVVATVLAILACLCIFDVAVLLTACMTVSDGAINAGKNKYGDIMLFHIEEIAEINLCDKHGQVVVAGKRAYRNADLNFVMKSGRVNTRHFERITSKQLENIKRACGF
jgi:hypothetical protein